MALDLSWKCYIPLNGWSFKVHSDLPRETPVLWGLVAETKGRDRHGRRPREAPRQHPRQWSVVCATMTPGMRSGQTPSVVQFESAFSKPSVPKLWGPSWLGLGHPVVTRILLSRFYENPHPPGLSQLAGPHPGHLVILASVQQAHTRCISPESPRLLRFPLTNFLSTSTHPAPGL